MDGDSSRRGWSWVRGVSIGGAGSGSLFLGRFAGSNTTLAVVNHSSLTLGDPNGLQNRVSIAAAASTFGVLSVSGGSSLDSSNSPVYVGDGGTGRLEVSGGSQAAGIYFYLGNAAGSAGVLTVDGANSRFSVSQILHVGVGGTGTVTASGGAAGVGGV